jgi:hypothetical protein
MASMEVGWNDIGGWSALLGHVGAAGAGRVVQAGDATAFGAEDLAIVVAEGRLEVHSGPGTILSDNHAALLTGAAADRDRVEELLARVAALEAQHS